MGRVDVWLRTIALPPLQKERRLGGEALKASSSYPSPFGEGRCFIYEKALELPHQR
ncbi:MAG: hypothetical protein WKF59_14315 [Chitinophagaceae bacterium]